MCFSLVDIALVDFFVEWVFGGIIWLLTGISMYTIVSREIINSTSLHSLHNLLSVPCELSGNNYYQFSFKKSKENSQGKTQ